MNRILRHPALVVEYETTRDAVIDGLDNGWSTHPKAPDGEGWRVSDASRDKYTTWRRLRLDDLDPRGQAGLRSAA